MRSNPNDLLTVSRGFVKSGDLLTVTIGRNVGNDPLTAAQWERFQSALLGRLGALLHPSASFGPFYGVGEWEGIVEESATVTLIVGYTSSVENVEAVLSTLADDYGQDAIAWAFGAARLATR